MVVYQSSNGILLSLQHNIVAFSIFYEGYCSIKPRYFPYDSHICYVTGFSQAGGVIFSRRYDNIVSDFFANT